HDARPSQVGSGMRGTDAGGRGHQIRAYRGHVANGRTAVAVADQVDLRLAADGDDVLDLLDQFLTPHFRGVQLAHFGHIDRGTAAAQCAGDAVPVVEAEHAVPAEHAVGEHDGIA